MRIDYERTTLFLGAGASLPGESGLPLFRDIRRAFFRDLGILELARVAGMAEAVEAATDAMAPEALLGALRDAGVAVSEVIINWFNAAGPHPNAIHRLAATFVERGARVWTTNYDTLIEECLPSNTASDIAAWPQALNGQRIVKPHGTLPRRVGGAWPATVNWPPGFRLAFAADEVVRQLPSEWAERLVADLSDRHVHVLGYAGADVDLYPPLSAGLSVAQSVHWYTTSARDRLGRPEWLQIQQRFPFMELGEGGRSSNVRVLLADDNPSLRFAAAAHDADPELPHAVPGALEDRRTPLPGVVLDHLPRIARADLLADLGLTEDAIAAYRRICIRPSTAARDRARAARRLIMKNVRRLRRRKTLVAGAHLVARLPATALGAQWARRIAAEDIHSGDTWPTLDDLSRWYENADERRVYGVGLAYVRALRYSGKLGEATDIADALLQRARRTSSPSHVATFSFQLTECLRMRGLHRLALEHMNLRLTTLAASVLTYWEEFERIACRLQQLSTDDDLGNVLSNLESVFAMSRESFASDTIAVARAAWLRLRGEHDEARAELERVRTNVVTTSPLLTELVDSHLAEVHRLSGNVEAARECLNRVRGEWFVNEGLKHLQNFLLAPRESRRLTDACCSFRDSGFDLGIAVATVLDSLHGEGRLERSFPWAQGFLEENGITSPVDLSQWSLVVL